MNRFSLLLLAVAGVPLLVHAQPAHKPAAVTDANATVPALQYQSAFSGQPTAPESEPTPDKVWVQANQDVAGSGHGGHGAHSTHGAPAAHGEAAAAPTLAPASPTSPPKPAQPPAADPHKDHKGHQGHEGHNMNMKGH